MVNSTTTVTPMESQSRFRLDRAGQDRVTAYQRVAYKLAHEYADKYKLLDRDDVISFAMTALCRAAATYDEANGASFLTYAYRCVMNALTHYAKHEWRRRRAVHVLQLSEVHYDSLEGHETPSDRRAAVLDELQRARRRVTSRDWMILWQHFGDGKLLREIGESLGYSKEYVRQLIDGALDRARSEAPESIPAPVPRRKPRSRCITCGQEFESIRSSKRYCSKPCLQAAHYQRKRLA